MNGGGENNEKQRKEVCTNVGEGGREERFRKIDRPTRGPIQAPLGKARELPLSQGAKEDSRILTREGENKINEPYRTQNTCVSNKATYWL